MKVAVMGMLRWMCGVTRSGRIKNESIRHSLGVKDIGGKIKENGLRWFRRVGRRNNDEIARKINEIRIAGKRA